MGFQTLNDAATALASALASSSATSATVTTGDGALFAGATTTSPFRCGLFDATTGALKEIIDVTGRATDTLTIVRTVEDATRFPASAWGSGTTLASVETIGALRSLTYLNVKSYGALGDGSTDDSAAIQAAVAAAKITSALGVSTTIYFPTGTYIYASTTALDLSNTNGITFMGSLFGRFDRQGGGRASGTPPCELRYTSSGSASFINAQGHMGFAVKGMAVRYSSATYTGNFIDVGNGADTSPSYGFTLRDALVAGSTTSAINAASLIYADGLVEGHFENFTLGRCVDAVIGRATSGGSGFCTALSFISGRFVDCSDAALLNPDQQTSFVNVVFEPTNVTTPAPAGVKSSSGARSLNGLSFIGCGFWDATNAGYWIDVYGSGVSIDGCFVDTLGTGAGLVRINTDASNATFDGLKVRGVEFHSGTGTPIAVGGSGTFLNIDIGGLANLGSMTDPTGALVGTIGFAPQRAAESLGALGNSGTTKTLSRDNVVTLTLTGNCTLTFPAVATGTAHSFTLALSQDGTGSRTVTWPASVKWGSAGAPTLSTAVNAVDVLTFFTVNGGTTWYGFLAQKGF